jgi:hypothetical protein
MSDLQQPLCADERIESLSMALLESCGLWLKEHTDEGLHIADILCAFNTAQGFLIHQSRIKENEMPTKQ